MYYAFAMSQIEHALTQIRVKSACCVNGVRLVIVDMLSESVQVQCAWQAMGGGAFNGSATSLPRECACRHE